MEQLDPTPEDYAFRDEVRRFYDQNLTDEHRRAALLTTWALAEFEYGRSWQKILYARGWGAPNWPVEYGGAGWSPKQRLIWEMESQRARPPEIMRMGKNLVAPCIMTFGTDEQKAYFLPRIISGEDWWAQGYSEPGAGSDLASLQLQATSDGDDYILNGSKIWTTFAQFANRIFCLVRTAKMQKKQEGITFLLIDMDSPGIELRPIYTIAGEHEFNQVFFTDVRVPKSRRLGEENAGWSVARHLLLYEHSAGLLRMVTELRWRVRWLNELVGLEADGYGGSLRDDPDFSRRLSLLEIAVEAADFAAAQLIADAKPGAPPDATGELLNIRNRETAQALTELGAEAVGYYGAPDQRGARKVVTDVPVVGPPHVLLPMPFYLAQRANTIAGGTPEIHRNNVAKHLLGL
ncbi:MAG: hypothetical protein ABS78_06730 [Phenylobacterium sp. SCN 70-31]|nr:MAG: hypothetical protein ABS78_06730 [Phenylobacterium sp. SCN 70-31]